MIFFDLGWTLEDETPAQRLRAEQTVAFAARRGIGTTADEVLRLQAEAGREGVEAVYPWALARLGLSADDLAAIRREFPWNPDHCVLVPNAREHLLRLPGRLGVIANQSRPMENRLRRYGILDLFEVRLCSCDVGVAKPDQEIFRLAEEAATRSGDKGPHWMVGDRVDNDVVPAKQRGWKTIRIVTGDYRLYQSKGPAEAPDHTVASLDEAVEILTRELSRGTGRGPGSGPP